jgi:hypothetical protein
MLSSSSLLICVRLFARSKTHHRFLDAVLQAFDFMCKFTHVAYCNTFLTRGQVILSLTQGYVNRGGKTHVQMEFYQLTYFLAAPTQNFRKAAELCIVAQSALNRQIAALEDELEVALFTRTKKRVTLTPAGQEFALYVRNTMRATFTRQIAALFPIMSL